MSFFCRGREGDNGTFESLFDGFPFFKSYCILFPRVAESAILKL